MIIVDIFFSQASFQQEWYEKAVLLKRKKNFVKAVMFLKFSSALLCSNREKQIVLFAEMALCYTEEKNYRKVIEILEDVRADQVLSQVNLYFLFCLYMFSSLLTLTSVIFIWQNTQNRTSSQYSLFISPIIRVTSMPKLVADNE